MRMPKRHMALLACACLLGGSATATAQRVDPNRIIDLHVNVEDQNQSFRGSVREGGKFLLTFENRGAYALSVVQVGEGGNTFAVTVLRTDGSKEAPSSETLETVTATPRVPTPLKSLPYVTVVIEGTRRAESSVAAYFGETRFTLTSFPRSLTSVFDTCCVTCGQTTACGCAVSMDCGNCCVRGCCPGGWDQQGSTEQPGGQPAARSFAFGRRCNAVPDNERLYPAPAGGSPRRASR